MSTQGWFTLGLTGLISLRPKVPYLLYFEIVHDPPWWTGSHAAASNKSTFLNQQLCSCGELQLMGIDNPQFKIASSPAQAIAMASSMSPVLLTTAMYQIIPTLISLKQPLSFPHDFVDREFGKGTARTLISSPWCQRLSWDVKGQWHLGSGKQNHLKLCSFICLALGLREKDWGCQLEHLHGASHMFWLPHSMAAWEGRAVGLLLMPSIEHKQVKPCLGSWEKTVRLPSPDGTCEDSRRICKIEVTVCSQVWKT